MSDLGKFIKTNLYLSVGNILGAAAILYASFGIIYLLYNPGIAELGILYLPIYIIFDVLIAILVFTLFLRYPPDYAALGIIALIVIPLFGAGMVNILVSGFGLDTVQTSNGTTVTIVALVVFFISYLFDYIRRRNRQPPKKEINAVSQQVIQRKLSRLEKL